MTWDQVAEQTGCSVSALTGLGRAKRVGFPHVMRIVRWVAARRRVHALFAVVGRHFPAAIRTDLSMLGCRAVPRSGRYSPS